MLFLQSWHHGLFYKMFEICRFIIAYQSQCWPDIFILHLPLVFVHDNISIRLMRTNTISININNGTNICMKINWRMHSVRINNTKQNKCYDIHILYSTHIIYCVYKYSQICYTLEIHASNFISLIIFIAFILYTTDALVLHILYRSLIST